MSLLAGKAIALAMYTMIAVILSALVGVVVALSLAPGNHVDTSAWLTGSGWAATSVGVANLAVAAWGWAALGLLLAIAVRSAPAAIGAGVAYALPPRSCWLHSRATPSRGCPGRSCRMSRAAARRQSTTPPRWFGRWRGSPSRSP
jgi:hypothetical protein